MCSAIHLVREPCSWRSAARSILAEQRVPAIAGAYAPDQFFLRKCAMYGAWDQDRRSNVSGNKIG